MDQTLSRIISASVAEFNRKPASFFELRAWKATSYRLFLLYLGPVILSSNLSHDYVKHFNCLSFAIRILCDSDDYLRNNDAAAQQLKYYVQHFKDLYTENYMVPNVHAMLHLAADAKEYSPLDSFSAFVFENNNQFIKRLLKKFENPLQQIHRRLVEKRRSSSKREKPHDNWPKLLMKLYCGIPLNCNNPHKKLKFETYELSIKRPDNCCILKNGDVVIISHIGKRNGEAVIIGKKVINKKVIENYPIDSTMVGIFQITKLSDMQVYEALKIKKKAVMFDYKEKTYVVPLLHL